jgi:transcriptional regulator with XRE-family HTH domain
MKRALAIFGSRIKASRESLGISQEAAAERAGISQSHWSKIERGAVDPSIGQVLRIQTALNAGSVESFFGSFPTARIFESAR